MKYRWYDLPEKELLELLHTDKEKGLTKKEAALRLKTDGKNVVNPVQKAPIRGYLLGVLTDLSAILMLALAALALIFSRDMGALMLLLLLLCNYAVAIFAYVRSQKTLEDLGYRAQPTAKVLRNGKLTVIPAESVVQGDILMLSYGDIVPCDARLLETDRLTVLEGNLFPTDRATEKDGEFRKVGKLSPDEAKNMVYASTVVTGGRARAAAVRTGEDTLVCRLGKNKPIAACHRLDVIGRLKKLSSVLGVIALIPVFILTLLELLQGGALIEVFLTSLAFAVAVMPELYSAFAYILVAVGVRSALGRKGEQEGTVFLKNPMSLAVLRKTDCLLLPLDSFFCGENTRVSAIYDGSTLSKIPEEPTDSASRSFRGKESKKKEKKKNGKDQGPSSDGDKTGWQPRPAALRILRYGLISTGLYGATRLILKNEESENIYSKEQEAILRAGERFGIYDRRLEEEYPILDHRDAGENGSLFETTLVHTKGQDVVILRGRPEEVLSHCTGYYSEGKVFDMDAYALNELRNMALDLVKNNGQPVAVATKVSRYNSLMRIVDCQTDLIFEGFLSLERPLLPGAAKQVRRLQEAGIRVLAYSERESLANRYLAGSVGLIQKEEQCISSSALPQMGKEMFRLNVGGYRLFEGFSAAQLKQTIDCLEEDCGLCVALYARELEGAYPMYAADVGFSKEDGKRKNEELRDPLWSKHPGAQVGCQALNHISDGILPESDRTGNGGINSMARALDIAASVYANLRTLLCYLAVSCGMRLTLLLMGRAGEYCSPVQMLTAGLIFDLFAVFVAAFERPGKRILKNRSIRAKSMGQLLPLLAFGMVLGGLTALCGRIFTENGILPAQALRGWCFTTALLLQWGTLTLLLRSREPVLKELSPSGAYILYSVVLLVFLFFCNRSSAFGGLFDVSGVGFSALLLSLPLPALILGAGVGCRAWFFRRRTHRKAPSSGSGGKKDS